MTLKLKRYAIEELKQLTVLNEKTGEGYLLPIEESKERGIGRRRKDGYFHSDFSDHVHDLIKAIHRLQNFKDEEFSVSFDFAHEKNKK